MVPRKRAWRSLLLRSTGIFPVLYRTLLSTGFAKRLAAFAGQHDTYGQENPDLCSNSVIFYGEETPKLFDIN